MSCQHIKQLALSRIKFEQKKSQYKEDFKEKKDLNHIVNSIKENGYFVIENYFSQEKCKQIKKKIDLLIKQLSGSKNLNIDEQDSDHRIFGSEKYSELINDFYKDNFLLDIAQNYFQGKIWNSNTLAARIDYKKGNLGSGGGWHRDAHHYQFKAIIYLSDVTIENGPFQILQGSHKLDRVFDDMETMNITSMTTRYTHQQVTKLIDQKPNEYKILTAKAGTLLLADTSTIHTGMPIKKGNRYTLFNYYYPSYENKEIIKEKFNLQND